MLIGLAATWLLCSLSIRALGILCSLTVCVAGFSIAAIPLWKDWQAWKASSNQYADAIEDLRLEIETPARKWDEHGNPILEEYGPWEKYSAPKATAPKSKSGEDDWVDVWPPVSRKAPDGLQGKSNAVGSTKIVMLPESMQKWKRPDMSEEGGRFPSETSDETILRTIERDFLLPEPTFSLRASFRLHLVPALVGLAIAIAGLLGSAWLFCWKRGPIQEINRHPTQARNV
jgi:hypothetical protein